MRKFILKFSNWHISHRGLFTVSIAVPIAIFTVASGAGIHSGMSVLSSMGVAFFVAGGTAVLFFGVLMILFARWNYFVEGGNSLYGRLISRLNKGYSYVHAAKNSDIAHQHDALVKLCDQLKAHFDEKTKSTCSVAIIGLKDKVDKENGTIDPDASLIELARDTSFKRQRSAEDGKDTVSGNTPFNTIQTKIRNAQTYNQKRDAFYISTNVQLKLDI